MNKKNTLILGVGNPLRRDDGAGPETVRVLTQEKKHAGLYEKADIIDGGTDGLGLVEYFRDYKKIILIDAVQMDLPPGSVKTFSPDKAVITIRTDSLSTHGFGIAELLKLAEALELQPDVTIIGIQPEDTGYGENLSGTVLSSIDTVIKTIYTILSAPKQ